MLVTITMDQEPIEIAMENLAVGAVESYTVGGETLIARKASVMMSCRFTTTRMALLPGADGQPYTVEDLVALTLVFEDQWLT